MTDVPGIRKRQRKDGPVWYWIASSVARDTKGFEPRTVRLHGDEDQRQARALVLNQELREWIAGRGRSTPEFDGTIAGLSRCYQADEDSPFRAVKHNTRQDYIYSLGIIEKSVGTALVRDLNRKDFARWHAAWKKPAEQDGQPRIRRAQGCMKVLRILFGYGKSMRYEGCRDCVDVLSEMRFESPPRRAERITFEQAAAIVETALARGLRSIALAQALQFELSLRQRDVIGEWLPADGEHSGIMDRGWRWFGNTWSAVDANLVLSITTTKTGTPGEWDLARAPLVMKALDAIPPDERVGPLVISEATGRPYRPNRFQKLWREIAREVGVPDTVKNMDSRAGGATEADEAGADIRDLQRHMTHSDARVTGRYVRGTLDSTSRVLELRAASRKRKSEDSPEELAPV